MQICNRIHQLKIYFHVTREIKRFVFVYIIEKRPIPNFYQLAGASGKVDSTQRWGTNFFRTGLIN